MRFKGTGHACLLPSFPHIRLYPSQPPPARKARRVRRLRSGVAPVLRPAALPPLKVRALCGRLVLWCAAMAAVDSAVACDSGPLFPGFWSTLLGVSHFSKG
ncbi:hypothetical protein EJB05_10980, partial [Eragrostis curvula]